VQTKTAPLSKQKYFFPALTPQFISPANYPGTGSSDSVFPSRLICHHHHLHYMPNHSLSCTSSARPKLKHKFTDFQKRTFVKHRRSVKASCAIVPGLSIYFILWLFVCYCRTGIYFKRLFNIVSNSIEFLNTILNICPSLKYRNKKIRMTSSISFLRW